MLYFKPWNVTEAEEEYGYEPVYERDFEVTPERDESLYNDGLNNAIHPIFARTNFPGIDYEIVRPALQFASLLIDTDCLLDYWHNMWFGKLERVDHGEGEDDWHWACFPSKSELSVKDKAMVHGRLRTMASMVAFHPRKKFSGAMCNPSEGQIGNCNPHTYGDFSGACSTIYYDERIVEKLSQLDRTGDYESFLRFHFNFARLLGHELAHAAYSAAWNVREEPCEYATMAEAEYDWENAVFGGIPDICEHEHAMNHTVRVWPDGGIGKRYLKEHWNIWIQGDCPDVEVGWEIPYFYVRKLFTASFWEETVPNEGAVSLEVPRLRGHLYGTDFDGNIVIERPFGMDRELYEMSLPEDCCIDDAYEGTIKLFAPGVEYEGLGRLSRIDMESLFPPDPCSRAWQMEHPSSKKGWDVAPSQGVKGGKVSIGKWYDTVVADW